MQYITLMIIALLLYCGCSIGRIFNDSVETFDINSLEPKHLNIVRKKNHLIFKGQLDKEIKQYFDSKALEVEDSDDEDNDDEFDYNKSIIPTKHIPIFNGNPFYYSGPAQKLELGIPTLNKGGLVKYKRKKYLNPYNFRNYKKTYPPRKSWSNPSKLKYNKLYF